MDYYRRLEDTWVATLLEQLPMLMTLSIVNGCCEQYAPELDMLIVNCELLN